VHTFFVLFFKEFFAMSSTKKACICSVCIALCYALPLAFHALGLGAAFSPIHLPVLLCGLVCGWQYGAFCGIVGPVISSLLSGMPGTAQLIYMVPELCAYGLSVGLLYRFVHTRRAAADVYLSLIPAMLLGRVVGGCARALFFAASAQQYSLALWVSAYFVQSIPAIVLQLVALPTLVLLLQKSRLIPRRVKGESAA
jgi:uncharacterized membrane protein